MDIKYQIEDEIHAEIHGDYLNFNDALNEIISISKQSWNEEPLFPPCTSAQTCEREYHIRKYDASIIPWRELENIPILHISATEKNWLYQ